jgi:hypothetical protein
LAILAAAAPRSSVGTDCHDALNQQAGRCGLLTVRRFREGVRGFGSGVAFEVAGVFGVGVVAPFIGAGVLVVPDGERGDLGFEVIAGGELAAA